MYVYVRVCVGCIESDMIVVFSFESVHQVSECFEFFFFFFGLTVICFHYLLFVQLLFPILG